MEYLNRTIEPILRQYLQSFSIVALTGPRQSGKSTMLQHMFPGDYRYISFDDYRMVSFLESDPLAFIRQYNDKVIFDEVQKVPLLFNILKIAVDEDRGTKGKFIITGSGQFNLLQQITESLAGRIGLLTLLPFDYAELPADLREDAVYRGSYPETVVSGYRYAQAWYSSYLETFVMKDVKSLVNIGNLHDFRQFIQLIAGQAGQFLNMSTISRVLGISVGTVKRWLSVLEAAYILFFVQPYHQNFGKRLTKSPKLYFFDTGLLCMLTGVSTRELFDNGPMAGSIFENFVVSEIRKKLYHRDIRASMYFFRSSNEIEVDLIVETMGKREWIEIKKSFTFRPRMLKPAESVMDSGDSAFLLYQGNEFPYKENVKVMNYREYLLR